MAELDTYDYAGGAAPRAGPPPARRWTREPLFDGETPRDEDVYNNEPELRGVDDIMSGVDALLAKPAPSMRQFAGRNSGPSIPVMRKQRSEARRGKKVSNASTTRRRTKPDVVPDAEPDPAMVAEALQYCQGLSMRVAADDNVPARPCARRRSPAAAPEARRLATTSARRAEEEPRGDDGQGLRHRARPDQEGRVLDEAATKARRRARHGRARRQLRARRAPDGAAQAAPPPKKPWRRRRPS